MLFDGFDLPSFGQVSFQTRTIDVTEPPINFTLDPSPSLHHRRFCTIRILTFVPQPLTPPFNQNRRILWCLSKVDDGIPVSCMPSRNGCEIEGPIAFDRKEADFDGIAVRREVAAFEIGRYWKAAKQSPMEMFGNECGDIDGKVAPCRMTPGL